MPTATGEITFEANGPARLIAVDNGDHSSDDLLGGNRIALHKGFAMAIFTFRTNSWNCKIESDSNGIETGRGKLNNKIT